jgi:predicted nucleotidyltransferase
MMPENTILRTLRKHKEELLQKYGIASIGLFGSCARGEENPSSDVDILVEFSVIPTYFKFLELEEDLEKILDRKVDLVTRGGLKPLIKDRIIEETVFI